MRKFLKRILGGGGERGSLHEELYSKNLRRQYSGRGIDVGLYTYGCFDRNRIFGPVKIGKYCSFAPTSYVYRRNHGIDFIGLTPFLYNPDLGIVNENKVAAPNLIIEDDVWLGHGSVILSGVRRIGRGAVIAAGAIVTRDVEPYTIVGGNPAAVIRRRFDDETIECIERSKWWDFTPSQLRKIMDWNPDFFYSPDKLRQNPKLLIELENIARTLNENG